MRGILWRLIIAVICCVLAFQLIPAVADVIGFTISGSLFKIIQICIAGLAVFYIIGGPPFPWQRT